MTRYAYPYTIDNGPAGGERITFLRRVPGVSGDRVEAENVVAPGHGPPMHVHHYTVESLTVQEGRMGYQRPGSAERFAGPGETVTFAAGEAHRFWNAGTTDLRCTGYIEPVDNAEYIIGALFASMRRTGSARPDPFDLAFLAERYRTEFTATMVPAPIRLLLFPLLVVLGRLLDRFARYADAPAPVRR